MKAEKDYIKTLVEEMCSAKGESGGIQEVYFAACGGSLGAFYSACTFLKTESETIKTELFNSNEFVHNTPRSLGEHSVVMVCSHGGDTPETVKAAEKARKAGATVIGMTYTPDSLLTQYCDYVVGYRFRTDIEESWEFDKPLVPVTIAVEILNPTEGYSHYEEYWEGLDKIDSIIRNAQSQIENRAARFASTYKEEKMIYTMGSGASYGAAYIQSICIFMEMQWINSACIHSGEYFHGPFEITDRNTVFLIQISEGRTRELDERALKFLRKYAQKYEIVDAKELGICTIDGSVVDYFNQSLFTAVYDIYNYQLAEARKHPLSVRRYMWKVEY